jgi:histidine triad (HIT) family protein
VGHTAENIGLPWGLTRILNEDYTKEASVMPIMDDSSPTSICIFCRLIAGELPTAKVFEDELTLAFMDMGQLNPGHTLIAVKRHAATLLDLTLDEAAAAMRTAYIVAHAVKTAFNPPGITLLQANGKEGGQTVFHFHMHVVPRHGNDGIALSWPRKDPPLELLETYAEQLRQAMG